jgi:hypothetical protein
MCLQTLKYQNVTVWCTSCVQDTQYTVAIVVRQVEVVSGPMPCLTELMTASDLVAMAVGGAIHRDSADAITHSVRC